MLMELNKILIWMEKGDTNEVCFAEGWRGVKSNVYKWRCSFRGSHTKIKNLREQEGRNPDPKYHKKAWRWNITKSLFK